MTDKVIIMSGPPGSGKSYEAAKLLETEADLIVSADHYFCRDLEKALGQKTYEGIGREEYFREDVQAALKNYVFEPDGIADAHAQCGNAYLRGLHEKGGALIVDNTNIWIGEKAPYYALAQWCFTDVVIKRLNTPLHICLERNTHNVPRKIIEMMWHVHHMRNDAGYLREELPWWNVE